MPRMGGLRKKLPWTATTMLIGCLAIAGAGIPTLVGLSGYYSKDYIIAQALSFKMDNAQYGFFFWIAVGWGDRSQHSICSVLWYMTFAGKPRDEHVYHHAHESPLVDGRAAGDSCRSSPSIGRLESLPGTNVGLDAGAGTGPTAGHLKIRRIGRLDTSRRAVSHPAEHQAFDEEVEEIHRLGHAIGPLAPRLAGFLLATDHLRPECPGSIPTFLRVAAVRTDLPLPRCESGGSTNSTRCCLFAPPLLRVSRLGSWNRQATDRRHRG